jgi:hypothetical protein
MRRMGKCPELVRIPSGNPAAFTRGTRPASAPPGILPGRATASKRVPPDGTPRSWPGAVLLRGSALHETGVSLGAGESRGSKLHMNETSIVGLSMEVVAS